MYVCMYVCMYHELYYISPWNKRFLKIRKHANYLLINLDTVLKIKNKVT